MFMTSVWNITLTRNGIILETSFFQTFGHFPIEIPIESEKIYHHGKELSYRENKMCSETSEAVGTIWEHAQKEFQKFLKIRITLSFQGAFSGARGSFQGQKVQGGQQVTSTWNPVKIEGRAFKLWWRRYIKKMWTFGNWPLICTLFLSDPSPIIGYACQWLPNSLTNSLLFSKLDWCDPGVWRCLLKTCWGCYCCWC